MRTLEHECTRRSSLGRPASRCHVTLYTCYLAGVLGRVVSREYNWLPTTREDGAAIAAPASTLQKAFATPQAGHKVANSNMARSRAAESDGERGDEDDGGSRQRFAAGATVSHGDYQAAHATAG